MAGLVTGDFGARVLSHVALDPKHGHVTAQIQHRITVVLTVMEM